MAFGAIAHSALFLPRRAQGVNGAVTLQPPGEVVLLALVGGVHQRRGEDEIRRGAVHSDRDVLQHGHTQQGAHIRVVGVRFERVPEEDQDIHLALGDLRADLLVAAQRPAQKHLHGQPQFLLEQGARRAGGEDFVVAQPPDVEARPFEQVLLAVVVGDEGDALAARKRAGLQSHGRSLSAGGLRCANLSTKRACGQ